MTELSSGTPSTPILAPHVPGTRIHMTFAPGKKGWGALSNIQHNRDLTEDLTRLRDVYGTTHLISLVEGFELDNLQIADLQQTSTRLGIENPHFPIKDLSIPSDIAAFKAFVSELVQIYQTGATFTIHCVGGLGRTGVLAAILLQELHGYAPQDSMQAVREARKGAIQTPEQENLVLNWKTQV